METLMKGSTSAHHRSKPSPRPGSVEQGEVTMCRALSETGEDRISSPVHMGKKRRQDFPLKKSI